jgi:hypothetical protein
VLLLALAGAALVALALWAVLAGGGTPRDLEGARSAARPDARGSTSALDAPEAPEARGERAPEALREQRNASERAQEPTPAARDGLWLCLADANGAALSGTSLESRSSCGARS